jgi:hypothetical protein
MSNAFDLTSLSSSLVPDGTFMFTIDKLIKFIAYSCGAVAVFASTSTLIELKCDPQSRTFIPSVGYINTM